MSGHCKTGSSWENYLKNVADAFVLKESYTGNLPVTMPTTVLGLFPMGTTVLIGTL